MRPTVSSSRTSRWPTSRARRSARRNANPLPPAALPRLRQRSRPGHARLRLLGRERAARALRPRGHPRLDRLRPQKVNIVVVGGGSWGRAFSLLLAERGHEVTLACRDPEQASAIAASGHNPRYLQSADLRRIRVAAIEEA